MQTKKFKVAVLGAGNMGTAIAQVIAKNGYQVSLWNRPEDSMPINQIRKFRENKKYLKGVKLSLNIKPYTDLQEALQDVQVVFFVIPSHVMEIVVKEVGKFLPCGVVCVDASKGIDEKSLGLIPDVIKNNLPKCLYKDLASISGPAIAGDMVTGGFTAMNIASKNLNTIKIVKKVLENKNLRLVGTTDMIGVEVAGSFKNVYAIVLGVCDGLKIQMNTKSALLVLATREISKLVEKMGGRASTVYGLAGLGDLIGTGLCESSRNRRFGEYLASGFNKDDAIKKVEQVVEGITATKILLLLSKKYKINLPFAKMTSRIIRGADPKKQLENFLKNFDTQE